jgi:hypothetical protein
MPRLRQWTAKTLKKVIYEKVEIEETETPEIKENKFKASF